MTTYTKLIDDNYAPKTKFKSKRVINLPEEPSQDNKDSLQLILRMPLSGERISRRFLKTDKIGIVYDFIDHLQNEGKC